MTGVQTCALPIFFRSVGYPIEVARKLTGLCTNSVPTEVLNDLPVREYANKPLIYPKIYRFAHLPQGAPTSPALANLCAYRLDVRLHALARKLGIGYTRYADDVAFSGDTDFERSAARLQELVCQIALEEGFNINLRKTRVMRAGVRQQLAGIVVNSHPNYCREEYDRLKAILTNCVRHGPETQNREQHADFRAHLAGRVAFVISLNEARGRRLEEIFRRIDWAQGPQSLGLDR